MTSVRKTALAVAVSSAMATMVASNPASAVNISNNGLGEVGLIPYYTVRNGFDTNISVVNTSDTYVVAFKIRFREADNSRDARDFNVFLSPNDVWTATVSMKTKKDGVTGVPVLKVTDGSCTAPMFKGNAGNDPALAVGEIDFTSLDYDGNGQQNADGGWKGIERTYDGHLEIISMGKADPKLSAIAAMAMHPSPRCQLIEDTYVNQSIQPFQAQFSEPGNFLKVSANLVSTIDGTALDVPVEMLGNFSNVQIMDMPSGILPNLTMASPAISYQVDDNATFRAVSFTRRYDAVSSLFSAVSVINEYETGSDVFTDWVITFPTKEFYVDTSISRGGLAPFEKVWNAGSSCDTVDFNYFDREEETTTQKTVLVPSPAPKTVVNVNTLCYESQVLYFGTAPVLAELGEGVKGANLYGVGAAYSEGWMNLVFAGPVGGVGKITGKSVLLNKNGTLHAKLKTGGNIDFYGLPVMGFSVVKEINAGGSSARSVKHSYARDIRL